MIPHLMRERWACPDLGKNKPEGMELAVVGSTYAFSECPRYYLRNAIDDMPADHLIGGVQHPAHVALQRAFEVEAGSVSFADMPAREAELTKIAMAEKGAVMRAEMESKKHG